MTLTDPYEFGFLRREEQARLDRQLTLGRMLREGRPARSSLRDRCARRTGRALVSFGQWLISRSRAADLPDGSWTLG